MTDIESNIRVVDERIGRSCQRCRRDRADVTLVAVSKTFTGDAILDAYRLGIRCFGENRVEEARNKIQSVNPLAPRIEWHMIGTVQHRKVKDAASLFNMIESVDSTELARRLETRLASARRTMPVLLEINVGGEVSKHGFSVDARPTLVSAIDQLIDLPHLELRGLMTIAPIVTKPENARPYFRRMRELLDEMQRQFPSQALRELSMGMSNDFEVAIEEGATMIRIGRAIFGPRD